MEDLQLVAAPASPDAQAPLHVWLLKATYDRVVRHQSRLLQDPDGSRRKEREDDKKRDEYPGGVESTMRSHQIFYEASSQFREAKAVEETDGRETFPVGK